MRAMIESFRIGLSSPLKGLELIFTKKKVRHAAIIPFAIVFFTFLVGIFLGLPGLFQAIPWLANAVIATAGLTKATFAAEALYYFLIAISIPVGIFSLLFAVFLFAQLFAAPFYALLAERVLVETGIISERSFKLGEWIKVSFQLFLVALVKVFVLAVLGLILLVLSFIPGLGLVSAFGLLFLTAYDVVDISLEELRLGLKDRLLFFRAELPAFIGLATSLGLIFLVPGLNFFLFPASIAGGYSIISNAKSLKNGRVT